MPVGSGEAGADNLWDAVRRGVHDGREHGPSQGGEDRLHDEDGFQPDRVQGTARGPLSDPGQGGERRRVQREAGLHSVQEEAVQGKDVLLLRLPGHGEEGHGGHARLEEGQHREGDLGDLQGALAERDLRARLHEKAGQGAGAPELLRAAGDRADIRPRQERGQRPPHQDPLGGGHAGPRARGLPRHHGVEMASEQAERKASAALGQGPQAEGEAAHRAERVPEILPQREDQRLPGRDGNRERAAEGGQRGAREAGIGDAERGRQACCLSVLGIHFFAEI